MLVTKQRRPIDLHCVPPLFGNQHCSKYLAKPLRERPGTNFHCHIPVIVLQFLCNSGRVLLYLRNVFGVPSNPNSVVFWCQCNTHKTVRRSPISLTQISGPVSVILGSVFSSFLLLCNDIFQFWSVTTTCLIMIFA